MEDKRTQKERMLAGELYIADCPELAEDNKTHLRVDGALQ